ncbi:MAG: endonuclease domain-containing protein [Pseudonocardia sp.]|nr:endonuclease domain-containing protein [Pseudonocardia sp.]
MALTALALTALETAPAITDGATFLDRALRRRVSFADLYAAYCRMLGATGAARVRPLLVGAADRADSRAERLLLSMLRRAGIGGFVRGLPFGPWEIDVAFPAERVAIEFDGWAFHNDPQRFQNDRTKGNALVAAGWTLLRFTWRDITDRPAAVVAQIREAVLPP